ncbi:TetR family transcriptional regulator [Rhodococcus sp. KBW08]|uniref:TetR/AcrR family transcriptional regulator n=1 Tax=Rhodococcus TaxID=1827 RepID=UPI000BB3640E|nr:MULTISPECIES: TetR/AcrR family transcriptional regulator [Rhodococcus]PBI96540.1 Bacterial regulatory protein, tetR family [Rhodococcus erythropolis]RQO44339.1 TetR family transcriptional regulator [Rhodococcus sp. KBW08]
MATARRTALLLRVSQSCAAAFVERGDTSTTIAELAERAEISERTFYRCFATKEESIWPMLDDGNRSLAAALGEQPRDSGLAPAVQNAFVASVGESFEAMTRSLMPIIFSDAALRRVWESATFETMELIRPEVARLIDRPETSLDTTAAAGQATLAVVAALREMADHRTPAPAAINRALDAFSTSYLSHPTGKEQS